MGRLHHIHGKGNHKHHIIDSYRLPTYDSHRQNAWMSCLIIVFCTDNEAIHIIDKGFISPQISGFQCHQLLTGFVWSLPLVNVHMSGQNQSVKHLIEYLLGCQQRWIGFILLLCDNIDLPTLTMLGWHRRSNQLTCRDSFSKGSRERIIWWPLAHCFAWYSARWINIRFWIVISTIIGIVGSRAEIVIEILIVWRAAASQRAGWMRMRRRSATPLCHDLKRRRVLSTKKFTEWLKEMWMNV